MQAPYIAYKNADDDDGVRYAVATALDELATFASEHGIDSDELTDRFEEALERVAE